MRSTLLASLIVFSSQTLFLEDPEPRVPKRTDAIGEEREVINATQVPPREIIKKKHVRENQEETDPIFYDATVSPADMKDN